MIIWRNEELFRKAMMNDGKMMHQIQYPKKENGLG
jgi:hypothetical protein